MLITTAGVLQVLEITIRAITMLTHAATLHPSSGTVVQSNTATISQKKTKEPKTRKDNKQSTEAKATIA